MNVPPDEDRRTKPTGRASVRRPTDPDLFGFNREVKILDSKVRSVFTPHRPISDYSLLFGRTSEVAKFLEVINTPGQHALLYGERGVGKSSLANVVSEIAKVSLDRPRIQKQCDQEDDFQSIVQPALIKAGYDSRLVGIQEVERKGRRTAVGPPILNHSGERTKETVADYRMDSEASPSWVAAAIGKLDCLFVIDEADAIRDSSDRRRLAELIKLLSDSGSSLKIMIVGIADTASSLIAAHPSVGRCLREVKLGRMHDFELQDIISRGAEKIGLAFSADVSKAIIGLSAGYPHFTHLLALKCAEEAVYSDRNSVNEEDLLAALELAVEDAEGTIRGSYESSVRSSSDMYRVILVAAARIGAGEFTALELRTEVQQMTGRPLSQGSLNNYLQRLVSRDGQGTILRRLAKGHYRFEDPRTTSYIRIVNKMI